MILFFFTFLLCLFSSICAEDLSPIRRIKCHLLINDLDSACQEARELLGFHPEDSQLWRIYIESLAKAGREKEMMHVRRQYKERFPNQNEDSGLIEQMAWGVITKGSHSSSPQVRLFSLLGSYFGQDARGVAILAEHLRDNNSCLRSASVQLASQLRDAILIDGIWELLQKEKTGDVRLEVIKALGKMKLFESKKYLLAIIAHNEASAEEKEAAIQSLVHLVETAERKEMELLVNSSRAGLRLLACKVIVHCGLKRDTDLLVALLKDHNSEVRTAALHALGMLRINHYNNIPLQEMVQPLSSDLQPVVAITTAWLMTLSAPEQAQILFQQWLQHHNQEIRLLASAALAACGKHGMPYLIQAFHQSSDLLVKGNLALALIGQRSAVGEACDTLFEILTKETRRLMWSEVGGFRALVPSTLRFSSEKEDPEAENYLVRLELFNVLSILQYHKAQDAIVDLLQKQRWGVTGIAAALLLTEGDESSIQVVARLLEHPVAKVRIQAALILSLWGREEKAIRVLQASYADADREMKEKIIEGIGRIGADSSIPFLIERLEESSQTLRILAAAALLQCLYH